jgi:hypothetical protein
MIFDKNLLDEVNNKFGVVPLDDLVILMYIVKHLTPYQHVLEIGSWLGRSAYAMARIKNPDVVLHLVDPFQSNPDNGNFKTTSWDILNHYYKFKKVCSYMDEKLIESYRDKIVEHNYDNLPLVKEILSDFSSSINYHKCYSKDFTITFHPAFSFVDGDHTYEGCRADLEKIGFYDELVAVHDFDQKEVMQATLDYIKETKKEFRVFNNNRLCIILDKDKNWLPIINELRLQIKLGYGYEYRNFWR